VEENENNSDSDSSTDSSDTVEGSSIQDLTPIKMTKYSKRQDFQTEDQYAMYVRETICPGMVVKCCKDFEEIKKGDIGTVLKVNTAGLYDLNVQVSFKRGQFGCNSVMSKYLFFIYYFFKHKILKN